ncbi:MAG: hypothetical protein JSW41_05250 [Candidatus Aenigmatarchaeota archaeon]|nr:MAG: hypothetical protein JSW41_05250 [Candidatus Aenigmarchaeota archaeon]
MKAKIMITFIALFLSISIAGATEIEVLVSKSLEGNLKVAGIQNDAGVIELSTEFHNTGSVSYKARVRMDVLDGTKTLFTGWSDKKMIVPGERKNFKIYWYRTNTRGDFPSTIRVYYGNEITEPKIVNLTVYTINTEDVFKIHDFKTYDDYLRFDLEANKTVNETIVFASEYPMGWIFEQVKIDEIKEGRSAEVIIPYQTDLYYQDNIKIMIVTKDCRYHKEDTFGLERLTGISKYINLFLDWLKNLFR